jgi:hypothetical protein
MLRVLQALFVLGVLVAALPAAAQEPVDEPATKDPPSPQTGTGAAAPEEPAAKPTSEEPSTKLKSEELTTKLTPKDQGGAQSGAAPVAPTSGSEEKPAEKSSGWHTFVTGYFRAPFALGFSPRPGPDNPNGPSRLQVSYGPNRTVDASYYSFAYTRLQEQDWAELFIHAKRKHAEAVIGWMGYWFQGAGFRNADAAWAPGAAYLTLDTDFEIAGVKPNIALTAGAWWPKFGTFDKYDTYTLGRFRQLGEQVKLTIPFNPDLTLTLVQGFGTNRDGSFNYTVQSPMYAATVGMDLIHYDNIQLTYKKYLDAGLHFNTQWSRDPNLRTSNVVGDKSYSAVEKAYLMTVGGEVSVSAPYVGRLWVSPSYIKVRNGWSLANGGVEVMHSLGGAGIASNYMAWSDTPTSSTGTGSMLNLGFLYENKLSGILGKEPGTVMPELTLSVFGMMANASLDLPEGSKVTQDRIKQFKYGADLTVQALTWLGFMARYDEVNYDLDHSGYVFSGITARAIFSTHFLSSESIYLQYTRYRYGDMMVLNGMWPWKQELVAGNSIIQTGAYAGQKPDMDVVKVQANVTF